MPTSREHLMCQVGKRKCAQPHPRTHIPDTPTPHVQGVPITPPPCLYPVPLCVCVYAHVRIPTYTDIAQAIYAPTCPYSPAAWAGGVHMSGRYNALQYIG